MLAQDQGNSDAILDDVACLLGCTRSSLHGKVVGTWHLYILPLIDLHAWPTLLLTIGLSSAVVASEKGVVVGRLTYREDGDLIDCQKMGVGGKAIPPNVDKVCPRIHNTAQEVRTQNNCVCEFRFVAATTGFAQMQVANIQSDALFILLVEKDAAFMRLAEDRFYNTYPCIILTAKGQPDVASRSDPRPCPLPSSFKD